MSVGVQCNIDDLLQEDAPAVEGLQEDHPAVEDLEESFTVPQEEDDDYVPEQFSADCM